ncbi:MAG: hypothetical protein FWF76_01165 [Oscillospiraceae bacterium]|nr:hypothetical protein [Oscillospiraceae bacterium]
MNTPERNSKNIEKMNKLDKVYVESEEDKNREKQYKSALEEATREYPLPTARKFAVVSCIAFWFFCFGGLLFGVDLRGIFPFLFLSLAVLVALHIPIFVIKKKIVDVVMGILFSLGCIVLAISLVIR